MQLFLITNKLKTTGYNSAVICADTFEEAAELFEQFCVDNKATTSPFNYTIALISSTSLVPTGIVSSSYTIFF